VRIWLRASWLILSVSLTAAAAHSQDEKSPFSPVPVAQRDDLANRLVLYTDAFRAKDWYSLFDLVSDVNKTLRDGTRMDRNTFAREMENGFDSYRLLKLLRFGPRIHQEISSMFTAVANFPVAQRPSVSLSQCVLSANTTNGFSRLGIILIPASPVRIFPIPGGNPHEI
jgi:hypothetical protein